MERTTHGTRRKVAERRVQRDVPERLKRVWLAVEGGAKEPVSAVNALFTLAQRAPNKIDAQAASPKEDQIGPRVRIFLHYLVGVVFSLAVRPYISISCAANLSAFLLGEVKSEGLTCLTWHILKASAKTIRIIGRGRETFESNGP